MGGFSKKRLNDVLCGSLGMDGASKTEVCLSHVTDEDVMGL